MTTRPPAGASDFALDFLRVKQVQRLGEIGLADALALAGTDALRPAEYVQEIRLEGLIGQHNGPVRCVAVARQVIELRRTFGGLAHGVK